MSLREILIAPHPVLEAVSEPVTLVNKEIKTLLDDMVQTMYHALGIGLAAPQIGVNLRVIVVDTTYNPEEPETRNPLKIVNPEIIALSDEDMTHTEGCLSVPEHYADVIRPRALTLKYLDEFGKEQILEAQDLLAICIQHEIDHLDGILFIDHLSNLKRNLIMRKLLKEKKLKELV
jgi:peptide deformylase